MILDEITVQSKQLGSTAAIRRSSWWFGGWQWSASTGTDSAPYFRVFNPTTQGKRFDPDGDFIRAWVPEISDLSRKEIHEPSSRDRSLWNTIDYPDPIVDQSVGRKRAIEAFAAVRDLA